VTVDEEVVVVVFNGGGSSGPNGGPRQLPSSFVTLTTRSVWVAYRHPSKPTVIKSPRVPPTKMSFCMGGLVLRSTFVILPSFRLQNRKGASGFADMAIPSRLDTLATIVWVGGAGEFVPVIFTICPPDAAYSVPSGPKTSPSAATDA